MTADIFPVETLERLNRQDGVDTRPILVRVLTDLFVQKPEHTAQEVGRYEELAGQLLDVVDVESRAAVARKLANDPRAPRKLIDRLIADVEPVSTPILAYFADAPRVKLLAVALEGGPLDAAAVASRADIDDELARMLAHHQDDLVLETLAANPAAALRDGPLQSLVERAVGAPALAAVLLRRDDIDAAALAPLYRQAGPDRRAAIREALAARPPRLSTAARTVRNAEALSEMLATLDAGPGQAEAIAEALADALALKPDEAARLATEASGEPFVMMLRAAGVSDEMIVRALLIAQPEIAQSVVRFFGLVEIAEATPRAAAAELVFALAGMPIRAAAPRHEPAFEPLTTPDRAGAARTAAASGRRAVDRDRQEAARRRG
ncbi:DUF2336 domain-containing protein [Methylopila sp. M107]|uniref:DUF2336 domain-containing protein n=1 Tax=Methylopila sp. M107 TaxID=1101190 RepID=UPI00037741F9|nr:DUF2336 domain-containing protein [Methylopila sp. M107]